MDLAAPGADRARHGAAVGGHDRADRRRAQQGFVAQWTPHRRAQRPDRGGVRRPRAREGVRSPAPRSRRGSRPRTPSSTRPASARSSCRHADAGDDVPRQPELRGDRGGRRPAGRRGAMLLGTCRPSSSTRGSSPSRSPSSVDGRQRAAVGRRLGRAGVRAAGRARAVARSRRRRRGRAADAGARRGASSRTSRFRYDADQPLIDGLSLVAEPGQTIAIVGPTGAGKTTLVNLLMRFYEIDGGRILARRPSTSRRCRARRAARPHRHGAAGHLAVRRHDPRQHRYGDPTPPRSRCWPRPAPPTSTASCTLPDGYDTRSTTRAANCQRRREAADHDRPGLPRRPQRS
jgi:hypothetical protein